MKIRCRLIKFCHDPGGDGGNVFAVVAFGPTSVVMRALWADRDGNVDVTALERLAPLGLEDAWAYREWVLWLRDLVDPEGGMTVREMDEALNRLSNRGSRVQASPSFHEEYPHDYQDTDRLSDELFERHVIGKRGEGGH